MLYQYINLFEIKNKLKSFVIPCIQNKSIRTPIKNFVTYLSLFLSYFNKLTCVNNNCHLEL